MLFINFLERDLASKEGRWSKFTNIFNSLNIENISDKIFKTISEISKLKIETI